MHSDQVRLIWLQAAITIIGAAVAYAAATPLAAKSVAFGGCAAMFGTLFLAWRIMIGKRAGYSQAARILRHAYRTAVERFMLVAFLLAAGFVLLKLAPVWLLAGFVAGQLAWLAVPVWMRLNKQNDN